MNKNNYLNIFFFSVETIWTREKGWEELGVVFEQNVDCDCSLVGHECTECESL